MNIGAKIKDLRKKRGITQERLAEYLNISAQAVSKWENGKSVPDAKALIDAEAANKQGGDCE